ncbi:MAG: class I SAM-dependent methyltransferase [candidate division Zixibacteria bacterium]|nr:class I SAM-dependent methyltransferase [candidate division Zixibacteria bacterium]
MSVSRETSKSNDSWRVDLKNILTESTPHLSDLSFEKLCLLADETLNENELLHLVSRRDPENEVVKQIVDSAAITNCLSLCPGCRLLDVGSGAGFPGIVLKLIFPDIKLYTLDSSPRKIDFQRRVCGKLEISATFLSCDFRRAALDELVDIVIVKALGSKRDVIRKSRNWLRSSGKLILMEGKTPDHTIESSVSRTNAFSHHILVPYSLAAFGSARHLAIVYKK